MKIRRRIEEIASLVPSCSRLVDVGTDHALLPIAMLKRNVIRTAVGIDKNPGPLVQARINRSNSDLESTLTLNCSNGLSEVALCSEDAVVIAGMGGETIRQILSETSWRGVLVLQPNRGASKLRGWLYQQGWMATKETLIQVNRQWFWTSQWKGNTSQVQPSDLDIQFGFQIGQSSPLNVLQWGREELVRLTHLPEKAFDKRLIPQLKELIKEAEITLESISNAI